MKNTLETDRVAIGNIDADNREDNNDTQVHRIGFQYVI